MFEAETDEPFASTRPVRMSSTPDATIVYWSSLVVAGSADNARRTVGLKASLVMSIGPEYTNVLVSS
jgi:hypothetical protein